MRQDGYFTVNVIYLPCFIIHRIFSSLNGQRLVSPSYQCRKCILHTDRSTNEKTKNPGLFHHPGLHAARPAQQNNRCKGHFGRPFHHFHPGKQNRSYRHSSRHGKPISVQACRRMFCPKRLRQNLRASPDRGTRLSGNSDRSHQYPECRPGVRRSDLPYYSKLRKRRSNRTFRQSGSRRMQRQPHQ